MSIVAAIRDLIAKGLSPEQALTAAEMIEEREASILTTLQDADAARRKRRAEQKAKERASRRVHGNGGDEGGDVARQGATSRDRERRRATPPQENITQPPPITPLGADAPTLPKGSDDDGSAQARARARGSRLPDEWAPSATLVAFAGGLGVVGQALDEAVAEFRDYWRGVPGRHGLKLDWDGTFRNRLRETVGKKRGTAHGNGQKGSTVEAGRRLTERLIAAERERELQAERRVDDGDPVMRLLPGVRR